MFFWRKKTKDTDSTIYPEIVSLKIKEQLEKQIEILRQVGILNVLQDGVSEGIIGIDNKEYKVPTLEYVSKRIEEKKELIKNKVAQGFTKIILVPFACPLEKIIKKYEEALIKHNNAGILLATRGDIADKDEKLELNLDNPFNIWNEYKDADIKNTFVYLPKIYDKENHQGRTKTEILMDSNNSWQIFLVEDMPNIPVDGNGEKIKHRKQIETNKTPIEYLKMLHNEDTYKGEEGFTPEAELIYAMTYLEEKNQVINDWQGKGNLAYELGVFFVPSASLPWFGWNRDFKRADLWKFDITNKDLHVGARVGVRI